MDTRGRLNTLEEAKEFVLAGHAVFTLVSTKTGTRFTYRVGRRPGVHDVMVLVGPSNAEDYRYLGAMESPLWRYQHGGRSRFRVDSPCVVAFRWFWRHATERSGVLPPGLEVWHEGQCGRCGRRLTVPSSIATGYGPECAALMLSSMQKGLF